ncbi:N-acetylglucosamine-6-phosphate deacetylase [Paenibacillus naphthalenovorans]|uniref:N-acetylglucosamine-6-phosphate deacetylase n=1 Tax=Paenibacillus naphthalenovorans TaxID=162209 RepID=UPI003D29E647
MNSRIKTTLILHANIVTLDRVLAQGYAFLQGDIIQETGPMQELDPQLLQLAEEIIDAGGFWLLPGFIDVHVHGGDGHDFMDASAEALEGITRFHGSHGTTTMLATTTTAPQEELAKVLQSVHSFRNKQMPYAQLEGVHLEGPFISPAYPGAQNPAYIVAPRQQWIDDWTRQYPGLIRLLTLAPEREGALPLIEKLSGQGIVVACGHTDATYAQIREAVRHGLRHAVHTFNAMKGLHHREPGVVGAVLTEDAIGAEMIADGRHIHPACIRLLMQVKRNDNLMLVTDAISAAGLGDGDYRFGGLEVTVRNGAATLKDGRTLAGSTLTMIDAFRFMVNTIGASVPEVSRMASHNPAKALGIADRTGSIAPGKQADLLLVSPELSIDKVWVKGSLVLF